MVAAGGVCRHVERGAMAARAGRGARFVLVSPLRDDLPEEAGAEWMQVVPNTDTALMLGSRTRCRREGLHDRAFLDRYCVGYPLFEDYLLGAATASRRTPAWAAAICGVPAETIVALARWLAGRRTLMVRRARVAARRTRRAAGVDGHGAGGDAGADRPARRRLRRMRLAPWRHYGRREVAVPLPTLPQGRNRVADFIPVARIADMLLQPGRRLRVQRPAPDLSRHPAGLLGGRQPVPPPPGPEPAAPRLRASGHAGGARDRLDRDGAPRRHRAARHHVAGARRHRRQCRPIR